MSEIYSTQCKVSLWSDTVHTFFYKNIVYKNIEPHFVPNLKNILIAQIVVNIEMFLSNFYEA